MSGNSKAKRQRTRRTKRRYWDTCVFLAWIRDESTWPEDVRKGIAQTIEMAKAGELVIVTSALTLAEILEARMTPDQKIKFAAIFNAPYLQLIDMDRRISAKSSAIRDHHDTRTYSKAGEQTGGSFMRLPDAIHLATALHMNVDILNTLDGSGKSPKRLDLLQLDGNVAGSRLSIKVPAFVPPPEFTESAGDPVSGVQGSLFTDVTSEPIVKETVPVTNKDTDPIRAFTDPYRFRRAPEIPNKWYLAYSSERESA